MRDLNTLRERLHEQLRGDLTVDRRPDGELMVRTPFEFPDGDRCPIHLSELPSGGLRLSDRGHTLMHISYEHDVDTFLDEPRGRLLDRVMAESGLQWDGGAFCLDTTLGRLPKAIFRFGQALTRIYALTFCSTNDQGHP